MRAPVPHVEIPLSSWARSAAGLMSLQFNVGRRWSRVEANPLRPGPALPVRLFGIVPTWFEGDVIEATVHNDFAQGCERVFIVYNESPDDTVKRAEAAGAEIASVYHTDFNDMDRRQAEIRGVINTVSPEVAADHVWWLVSDADEFVHAPSGLRIVDDLSRLDRRFRVVVLACSSTSRRVSPRTSLAAIHSTINPCARNCRWPGAAFVTGSILFSAGTGPVREVVPGCGMHRVQSPVRMREPREGAFMHHFQYRNRPDTSERLRRLCEAQEDGVVRSALADMLQRQASGARRRWATLDYVYSQDWAHMQRRTPRGYRPGVDPKPWTFLVPPADARIARWYSTSLSESSQLETGVGRGSRNP